MANGVEETLLKLLGDADTVAAQSDLAQAVALARQELSFRQRAGAAAARLRRARDSGADAQEIAAFEAALERRTARLDAAARQARAADLKRPQPDPTLAQVFGRAEGTPERPPLTLAILSETGEVIGMTVAGDNSTFHLTHEGDLQRVTLQLSDASGRVLFRTPQAVHVVAGTVLYVDVPLGVPQPDPGPVPTHPKMPELIGQSEDAALELLNRLGVSDVEVVDEAREGLPGVVIGQSPDAGAKLNEAVEVMLTIRRTLGDAPEPRYLPGYVGGTLADAEVSLKQLRLSHTVKPKVDDGPADIVLDQVPAEGTRLDRVDGVELTVSQSRDEAPEYVTIPETIGKSRELALELVEAAGLKARVEEASDPKDPAGVIVQDPTEGTTVKRGSTVILVVNTPPEGRAPDVIVPPLRGRSESEAVNILMKLSLKTEVERRENAAPKGEVVGQSPEAGARVEPGASIRLAVSAGPGEDGDADPEISALVRMIAGDTRSADLGLDADGIRATLRAGGIDSLAAARAVAELPAEEVRDRMKLGSIRAARTFRVMLRTALKRIA